VETVAEAKEEVPPQAEAQTETGETMRINPNETVTYIPPKPIKLKYPAEGGSAKPAQDKASPSAGGQHYLVQAGSFSSEENARKLAKQLAAAKVDHVDVNGKTWWRVRVGPFASRNDADSALDGLRSAGITDARVIKQ
jgi:cell division protein FtsN